MQVSTVFVPQVVTENKIKKSVEVPAMSLDGGKSSVLLSEVQKLNAALVAAEKAVAESKSSTMIARREKLIAAGLDPVEMGAGELNLDDLYMSEIKASRWADAIQVATKEGAEVFVAEVRTWLDENQESNAINYLVHAFGLSLGLKAREATVTEAQEFLAGLNAVQLHDAFRTKAKFREDGSYTVKAARPAGGLKVTLTEARKATV